MQSTGIECTFSVLTKRRFRMLEVCTVSGSIYSRHYVSQRFRLKMSNQEKDFRKVISVQKYFSTRKG